jgi:hypothetical protein
MRGPEGGKDRGEELYQGVAGRDPHRPAWPQIFAGQAPLESTQLIEHPLSGGDRDLARRRWRIAGAGALEQAHPQPPLQAAEPAERGRMVDAKPARGLRQ